MKKTVNINVSGIIFHIDEDAYTKLNSYLDSLKIHFQTVEGSSDIIDDIEARIAELLQEKLSDSKQVISIRDVDEVIEVMGQPSQFDEEGPAEEQAQEAGSTKTTKRFYRDPDEKVIAGVCSGIGAYLHWDPVIIRILFIISLFAGGFGIALYLILWIVIPEAITTAEKLQMRGEKVNISNIEKSIQEEVNTIKDKLNNLTETTKEKFRKGSAPPSPIEQIFKWIIAALKIFGKILLVILGIAFTLIGISFLIALLALIFGWGGAIFVDHNVAILSFPAFMGLILGCTLNPFYIQLTLLILLGVPVILLLYTGIRLIFRLDGIKYVGVTAFNIWLIGLVIAVFYSFKIYNLFKAGDIHRQQIPITQPVSDTIYLKYVNLLEAEELQLDLYAMFDDIKISKDYEGNFYLIPVVKIEASDGEQVEVTKKAYSRGATFSEAKIRSREIHYNIQQKGDTILFDPLAQFPEEDCWRGQELYISVKVPEGKYLSLDEGRWRMQGEYYHYTRITDGRRLYKATDSDFEEVE